MDKGLFDEIVRACVEDKRLLEIVKNVASMSEKEREIFKKKVLVYFADKTSDVDVQAYRFFRVILEGENASLILEEVKVYERDKG